MSWSSKTIFPSTLQPSIVSFILLKHLKNVDLPQPEGPINDIISLEPTSRDTLLIACLS